MLSTRRVPSVGSLFSLAAAAAALTAPGLARAQTSDCDSNADCPQGFACEVTGSSGCPGVACPDGAECEPLPECEPEEFRSCVPGPCESDADCGSGLVCHTFNDEICGGGDAVDCPPGVDCPQPEPREMECTTRTESACVPRYVLPCEANTDCGEGFLCVEREQCACGGSSGGGTDPGEPALPPPDGDFAPPDGTDPPEPAPLPPECGCEPTGERYCEITETPCSADADCPASWTCEVGGASGSCTRGVGPDGEEETVCITEPAQSFCMPPYYGAAGGIPGVDEDYYGGGATGAPRENTGGLNAGESAADGAGSDDSDDGGCSVSSASRPSNTAALLFGLVGLAALSRRKRG